MKLSISNIAWGSADDEAVYALLSQYGYQGIDIAPSRVWGKDHHPSAAEADVFLANLKTHGLCVAGMQSLLFGHPELVIFGDAEMREKTAESLKRMVDTGALLNATAVVFGSPKNRIMGEVSEEKLGTAETFFRALGDYAHAQGVVFALEPNPASYGGDFLTRTEDACAFVKQVGSPGLKVNFDMGTVIENGEDGEQLIAKYLDLFGHVHVSLPKLAPVSITGAHRDMLTALSQAGYCGWVTIEMTTPEDGERIALVERAIRELKEAVE